jgi:hypothetical protein
MKTLGLDSTSPTLCRSSVDNLLKRGHDRETILAVAKFYRDTCGDEVVRKYSTGGLVLGFNELQSKMRTEMSAPERNTNR